MHSALLTAPQPPACSQEAAQDYKANNIAHEFLSIRATGLGENEPLDRVVRALSLLMHATHQLHSFSECEARSEGRVRRRSGRMR